MARFVGPSSFGGLIVFLLIIGIFYSLRFIFKTLYKIYPINYVLHPIYCTFKYIGLIESAKNKPVEKVNENRFHKTKSAKK